MCLFKEPVGHLDTFKSSLCILPDSSEPPLGPTGQSVLDLGIHISTQSYSWAVKCLDFSMSWCTSALVNACRSFWEEVRIKFISSTCFWYQNKLLPQLCPWFLVSYPSLCAPLRIQMSSTGRNYCKISKPLISMPNPNIIFHLTTKKSCLNATHKQEFTAMGIFLLN